MHTKFCKTHTIETVTLPPGKCQVALALDANTTTNTTKKKLDAGDALIIQASAVWGAFVMTFKAADGGQADDLVLSIPVDGHFLRVVVPYKIDSIKVDFFDLSAILSSGLSSGEGAGNILYWREGDEPYEDDSFTAANG